MPGSIDRDEVHRLLREEQAQLVEVLPPGECEDEHLPVATAGLLARLIQVPGAARPVPGSGRYSAAPATGGAP